MFIIRKKKKKEDHPCSHSAKIVTLVATPLYVAYSVKKTVKSWVFLETLIT